MPEHLTRLLLKLALTQESRNLFKAAAAYTVQYVDSLPVPRFAVGAVCGLLDAAVDLLEELAARKPAD